VGEVKLRVVMGAGWTRRRRLSFKNSFATNIEMLDSPVGLGEAIKSSDVVITLGGRTTYEAFALGRPVLCIPCGSTARYVESLHRHGFALAIPSDPELAAAEIAAALEDEADLTERAKRAFFSISPNAADRVAKLCLEVR
jgi:UDP-N-acetylglucosamine:LPS N-acetylglucosamine transferase